MRNLWPLAVAAIILEIGLYLVKGERWFSFYGHAVTALVLILPLAWVVFSRFKSLGVSRWWPGIFFTIVGLAATIQIAYWTSFFSSSQHGVMLAIGRSMALERAEPYLAWAALGVAGFGLWLIWKAVSKP